MRSPLRLSLGLAALLLASALPLRAQSLAGAHDMLGDDPLTREIRQAPVTTVTWVAGAHGQPVPVLLGSTAAEQPLAGRGNGQGLAAGAGAGAGTGAAAALGDLSAGSGLPRTRTAASRRASRSRRLPRQALKQAHHIHEHGIW